eukprot:147922_1
MGNSNDISSSSEYEDEDDSPHENDEINTHNHSKYKSDINERYKNDKKNNDDDNNNKSTNSITSAAKSMFGGIKSYFTGYSKNKMTEIETLNEYQNKFVKTSVFKQLERPNYHFADQGLQWVQETMQYDEEGDGYHISIGPLS